MHDTQYFLDLLTLTFLLCSLSAWNISITVKDKRKKNRGCIFFTAQGVYARHLLGNASAPNAAEFGQCVEPLAKVALHIAKRSVLHVCRAQRQEEKPPDADENGDKNVCKRKEACGEAGLIRGSCSAEILSAVLLQTPTALGRGR